MEVGLIEYFPGHGFEVWITDLIETGEGMGDVFCTHDEARKYVQDHDVPVVDISHIEMRLMEGVELRTFLSRFLVLDTSGGIIAIKQA